MKMIKMVMKMRDSKSADEVEEIWEMYKNERRISEKINSVIWKIRKFVNDRIK